MPRLVRNTGEVIEVCQGRLFNHAYGTIYVADCDENTALPDGWVYYAEDVEVEDFVQPWKQPEGAHDAYEIGALVLHANKNWRSTIKANVWEPGVSGWVEEVGAGNTPAWLQPTGAHDAYSKDAVVTHAGVKWTSLLDANVWEPGVYGWRKSQIDPPTQAETIPDWVQPTGAHDAYALGAKVRHNGFIWISDYDANVWEPGVYGWHTE